jgi:hypothetical protein
MLGKSIPAYACARPVLCTSARGNQIEIDHAVLQDVAALIAGYQRVVLRTGDVFVILSAGRGDGRAGN